MSTIIKATDKRSGLTYAYLSESYWDKEKKSPRCKRTLIGRVDPETGEILPTDGRRKKKATEQKTQAEEYKTPASSLGATRETIRQMEEQIANLKNSIADCTIVLESLQTNLVSLKSIADKQKNSV